MMQAYPSLTVLVELCSTLFVLEGLVLSLFLELSTGHLYPLHAIDDSPYSQMNRLSDTCSPPSTE